MDYNNLLNLYKFKKFQEVLNIINKNPNPSSKELNLKGLIYFQQHQDQEAMSYFLEANKKDENYCDPLINLGKIYFKNKNYIEAKECFLKAQKINLNLSISDFFLAQIYFITLKDFKKTEFHLLKAIDLDPLKNDYYLYLTSFYFNTSAYEKAINFAKKSYQLKKSYFLLKIIAQSYLKLNNVKESNSYYLEYLKYFPQDYESYYAISLNHLFVNDRPNFWLNIKKCLNINPKHSKSILTISRLKEKEIILDENKINEYFSTEKNQYIKADYGFALFNINHNKNNFEKASHYVKHANNLIFKSLNQQLSYDAQEFNIYSKFFNNQFFKKRLSNPKEKKNESKPIFIVGLPRSGSTLLEGVLNHYSLIDSFGEIDYFYRAIEKYYNDLSLDKLDTKIKVSFKENNPEAMIKNYYLELINCKNIFFTDKMLSNFRFIGFIKSCFPQARIIHCIRDRSDNLFSIYSNHLDSTIFPWMYDIKTLKDYYNSYVSLMSHWKNIFEDEIYDFHYERFVNNTDHEAKKLISYLGIEWDENCIKSVGKDELVIKTASYDQARGTIYSNHLKQSENYKAYLGEIFTN